MEHPAQEKERDERLQRKLLTELGVEIRAALADTAVVEVDVNADGSIWVERHGQDQALVGRMPAQVAMSLICTVAALTHRVVTQAAPILEATLPDGSRFHATVPPITAAPTLAIRKHLSQALTLDDYLAQGVMDKEQHALLRQAVAQRQNIIVAGSTGSGKTTLTNALIHEISQASPQHRLLILEDTPEIICSSPNYVAKRTTVGVDMRALVRSSLRMRPDRIIVGEVRGGEAEALIRAWNTGHPGGVATLHCSSAYAALAKLEEYVADAVAGDKRRGIAEAVDLIAFITRSADRRVLSELLRVQGFANDNYLTETLTKEKIHVA